MKYKAFVAVRTALSHHIIWPTKLHDITSHTPGIQSLSKGSSSPRRVRLLNPEDVGMTRLRNVCIYQLEGITSQRCQCWIQHDVDNV